MQELPRAFQWAKIGVFAPGGANLVGVGKLKASLDSGWIGCSKLLS